MCSTFQTSSQKMKYDILFEFLHLSAAFCAELFASVL